MRNCSEQNENSQLMSNYNCRAHYYNLNYIETGMIKSN